MSGSVSPSANSPKVAPKLPPRTYKRRTSSNTSPKIRPSPRVTDETEYSSEKLISEKVLPQMVTVTSGYDGATPENCVSIGDEFVICFAKSTKVLPAKLEGGTEEVHIPVDSMLSVGVVRKDGIKTYTTVNDLLKLSELPMAVEVNRAFTSNGYHVEKGSIMYIRGRDGGNALLCQHESGGEDLTLMPDVVGDFSTDPENATIFIADYTTLYNIYPVTVKLLQKGVDVDDHLSQYIRQNFVLEEPIVKLSLIATTDVNGTRIENPAVVEIPMDIPLYFKCTERPELDMERVYSVAADLCKEFDPSKVDVSYGTRVVSENDYAVIYQTVDNLNEDENYYVAFDIICPNPRTETLKRTLEEQRSNAKETPPAQRSKKRSAHSKNSDKKSHSTTSDKKSHGTTSDKKSHGTTSDKKSHGTTLEKKSHGTTSERTPYCNVTPADQDLAYQLAVEKNQVKQLTEENNQLASKVKQLTADNSQLTVEVDNLKLQLHYSKQSCEDLEAELVRVNKNVTRLSGQLEQLTDKRQPGPANDTTSEENQERLRKMSTTDVTDLLKNMGYQMYESSFTAEDVDGMLLSTLEEEHLKELGVTSSIHCRRFLNIIQGKESVDKYFKVYN